MCQDFDIKNYLKIHLLNNLPLNAGQMDHNEIGELLAY